MGCGCDAAGGVGGCDIGGVDLVQQGVWVGVIYGVGWQAAEGVGGGDIGGVGVGQ